MQETKALVLHDIADIVVVQEYSLYYLIALVVVSLCILSILGLYLSKVFKESEYAKQRKKYLHILQTLELEDTKNTAYSLSKYGFFFKEESKELEEAYTQMHEALESYKYKKNVDAFDMQTLSCIKEFKELLHV